MSVASPNLRAEGGRFARFCAVGALGFLVDAGLLLFLIGTFGLGPFAARALSILAALTATWAMHRNWTFGSHGSGRLAEWARFLAVNGAGGGLNYAVYSALLLALPATAPLAALVAGSAAALAANYLGSRLWAFRGGNAVLR